MEHTEPAETALAADMARIARVLGSAASVDATAGRAVDVAIGAIDGCRHAGIFLIHDGTVRTAARTDPLVEQVEQLQMQTGEGPCLDAVRSDVAYNASDDLATDPHYPQFGPQATNIGIRSAIGLRLLTDRRLGAMNLYSDLPHAFGIAERAKAVILAAHCSTALEAAQVRERAFQTSRDDLHAALSSRGVIGQAQGILMERERLTAEQAFEVLRHASQNLNIKLRDVAQRLVDTGTDPRDAGAHDGQPRAELRSEPPS